MKRIAVVTGASSGLGREFVRQIAGKSPHLSEIWVMARREERLLSLKEELEGKSGPGIRPIRADITDEGDLGRFTSLLAEEKPRVELLVNAAGAGYIGKMEEVPLSHHLDTLRLNAEALTAVTLTVLPLIPAGGRIINVASGSAFMAQPGFGVYAASKAYVLSFSRALHHECRKKGISVTTVCPGPVKTEFFRTAEEHRPIAPYKKRFMEDPVRVVKAALKDAGKRKELSISSLSMKVSAVGMKVLPHGPILRILAREAEDR